MSTDFRGAIFDVDGVLVDSPHERAWRDALKELMETQWSDVRPETSYSPERFTPQVYQQVMSGKPRFSGAQAALEYFDVPDAETRSRTYGDRKQSMVIELIEAGDFTAYPDALRFIIAVKDAGIRVAAASSSKNAKLFLRQIRLDTWAATLPAVLAARRSGCRAGGLAGAAGELGAVVRPDALAPVAVAAGFTGQQIEQRAPVAGVAGRHAWGQQVLAEERARTLHRCQHVLVPAHP